MRRLLKFENQLLLRSRRELGGLSAHIQFERDAELVLYSHQTASELNWMDTEVRLLNSGDAGVVPPQLKDEKFSPKNELIDWSRTLESETISERGRKDEAAAAASD